MPKPDLARAHAEASRRRPGRRAAKILFFALMASIATGSTTLADQTPAAPPRRTLRRTGGFPGSTLSSRLSACIASLPRSGGVCDARNDTGNRTIAATVTIPAKVTVLLGTGSYRSRVLPAFILAGNGASLIGVSESSTAVAANLPSGAVIEGPSNGGVGQRLKNMTIDDTSPQNAGSVGIEWENESAGIIRNVHIRKVETGLVLEGVPRRSGCYYNEIEDVSAYDFYTGIRVGAHANSNTFINLFLDMGRKAGIQIQLAAIGNIFVKPDVEAQAKGATETAYVIDGNSNTILQPYAEAVRTGLEIGPYAAQNVILGGTQSSLTKLVVNHARSGANFAISPSFGYASQLRVPSLAIAGTFSTIKEFHAHLAVRNSKDTGLAGLEANFLVPGAGKGGAAGKLTYGGVNAIFQIPSKGVAPGSTHAFVVADTPQTLRNKTLAEPKLTSLPFARLPKPVNGMMIYCPNCVKATPCRGGGKGAIAKGIAGAWDCN